MADELLPFTFRFGAGVNTEDASGLLQEGEARLVENWRISGAGRVTTRRSLKALHDFDEVCGVFAFPYAAGAAAAVLNWTGLSVELYRVDAAGGSVLEGTLAGYESGVTSRPRFTGDVLNQALFLADVDQEFGLTVWDPNLNLGATAFFQPTFDFDQDEAFDVATPNIVREFANHLWIFGYGDEGSPIRGEVARWSYLGLVNDGQGSGDAGVGGATGSTDLFDREAFNPSMCARGDAVRGAVTAGRVMLFFTDRMTRVLYGTDSASWALDTIDKERGVVNELACCDLGGNAYWMSAVGPCRWRGGSGYEPLEVKVRGLVSAIDMDSVVAVPHPEEHQVRFYYRKKDDMVLGANRALIYDERVGGFIEDTYPVRIFCAGELEPSGLEGPEGAATSLSHLYVTASSAQARWTPGDTSPETTQIVSLRQGDGDWQEVARYPGSRTYHRHNGLQEFTGYTTRIDTIRNGQTPDSGEPVEQTFTTERVPVDPEDPSDGYRGAPEITAEDYPIFGGPLVTQIENAVLVTIEKPAGSLELQRRFSSQGEGAWENVFVSAALPSQYIDYDVNAGTPLDYRARNVVEGTASDWTPVQTVTPTYNNPN